MRDGWTIDSVDTDYVEGSDWIGGKENRLTEPILTAAWRSEDYD
jgi:hypothetical protein